MNFSEELPKELLKPPMVRPAKRLKIEPDLESIRSDPRFAELMARWVFRGEPIPAHASSDLQEIPYPLRGIVIGNHH